MTLSKNAATSFLVFLFGLLLLPAARPGTALGSAPPAGPDKSELEGLIAFGCDDPRHLATGASAEPMDAAPGERVILDVSVTNMTSEPTRLVLGGCQAYFRAETIDGIRLFDLAFHLLCPQELDEILLTGNQTLSYRFAWAQTDDQGQAVPAPGEYVLRGYFASPDPRCLRDAFVTIAVVGTEPTVRVRPERTQYRPGEAVEFRALLTNFAAEPLTFHSHGGCRAFFEILSRDGRILKARGRDLKCPDPPVPLTLQPGETAEFPFRWDQRDEAGNPVPVPGEFVIRAIVPAVGGRLVGHALIAIGSLDFRG